jgi:hypothetical protein
MLPSSLIESWFTFSSSLDSWLFLSPTGNPVKYRLSSLNSSMGLGNMLSQLKISKKTPLSPINYSFMYLNWPLKRQWGHRWAMAFMVLSASMHELTGLFHPQEHITWAMVSRKWFCFSNFYGRLMYLFAENPEYSI